MKPLSPTKTAVYLALIAVCYCFVSNDDYHTLYVEQHIAQGMADELNKPRETLNRLQEDAGKLLALQEMK